MNKIRLDAKYKYKTALKYAMVNEQVQLEDELFNLYIRKDMTRFWRKWSAKFCRNAKPPNVNGLSKDEELLTVSVTVLLLCLLTRMTIMWELLIVLID